MRTQPFSIIVFVLSLAALASGQTPTGIQRTGVIGLLRAEGKIPVGSGPLVEETTDNATGGFVSSDYTNYTPPTLPPSTMIGPCYVSSTTLPPTRQPPTGLVTTFLDAGPVINLNGPNGTKQIPQTNNAYFLQVGGGVPIPTPIPIPGLEVLPPYLDPGTYTIDNGSGGADVGPFTATLTVPSPGFVWTSADANTTIARSAGIDIQWTGGDPTTTVSIQGVSSTSTLAGSFTCVVPNNGEFVVTSDVLASMPATPAGALPGTNTLGVSNATMTNFSAPGIDLGIFSYQAGGARFVVYQ